MEGSGGGADGEGEGEEEGRGGSKLCISVNMQLLTLINLPFSLLGGCVWEGGGDGGCGVDCYHICTRLYTN